MISLSDDQLRVLMTAAAALDYEKRDTFLQRVAGLLGKQATGCHSDADVAQAAEQALRSLSVNTAA
jgi:hypothetical protein